MWILNERQFILHLKESVCFHCRYWIKYANNTSREINRYKFFSGEDFCYTGNDLGFTYSNQETKFRVWAPGLSEVKILLYDSPTANEAQRYQLTKDIQGTWYGKITGDLNGKYYLYEVVQNDQILQTPDPYSRGLAANGSRSLIFDPEIINPPGWSDQTRPQFSAPTDAVIYETHIRDFSRHPNSGIRNKGKYLAFTETNTQESGGEKTGLAHLLELGITHVHLMPIYDFGSVNELNDQEYNWGYDPMYYNVPEGSYATNPDGIARLREVKEMMLSLHQNGLRVIMDVVYNHTYNTISSAFDVLVPQFYYRLNSDGSYSNASGCGNEIASEKFMVRKFILDSLKYWVKEYQIDGFRFDLLGVLDIKTMTQIVTELREIEPSLIFYGEPWRAGDTPLEPALHIWKGRQKGLGFAVFNDHFRDAIKGDLRGSRWGFVQGASCEWENIKRGIQGAINDFAAAPTEAVNYVSAHDDLCLWDKLVKSCPGMADAQLMQLSKLANGIILTSQGIAFLHGGEEFGRTKSGHPNTYNAGDDINQYDYRRKGIYRELFEYYAGLISLRREHPAFRMTTAELVRKHLRFLTTPEHSIGFILGDFANGDSWEKIVVIFNCKNQAQVMRLPETATWIIVANEYEAGVNPVVSEEATFNGKEITLPPYSMKILHN